MVIDKQDCSQTGQDTCAWEGLIEKADAFLCPVYDECYVLYHNGNDAISLNKISDNAQFPFGAFIDVFGKIGEDPGLAWTDADGTWWTRNRTLIRNSDISTGTTMNPTVFDPTEQWDTLSVNDFTHLGWHEAECSGNVGIEEVSNIVQLYPNPTTGMITIATKKIVEKIEIYNLTGQVVQTEVQAGYLVQIDLSDELPKGQYILKTTYRDGASEFHPIVRQ